MSNFDNVGGVIFPCKEDLEKLRVIVVTLVTSGRYDLYYHPNVSKVIPTEKWVTQKFRWCPWGWLWMFLAVEDWNVSLNIFTLPNSVYYKLSIGMGSHDQPWCVWYLANLYLCLKASICRHGITIHTHIYRWSRTCYRTRDCYPSLWSSWCKHEKRWSGCASWWS